MGTVTPLDQVTRFEVTVVYAHPEATVDIVLVHGLNGHPIDTWKAKNGVFWPTELLPVTLEEAKVRILVYGYNADVYTFESDSMIHQHAQSLLGGLRMERMSGKMDENSIIWVAHNLGGILVKKALELSRDPVRKSSDQSRSIYVSTFGTIFLGTPHVGADSAKWAKSLQTLAKTVVPKKLIEAEDQLLKTLQNNYNTLQEINLHFMDIYHRFEILIVHEALETDFKGTKSFVVDQALAFPLLQGIRYYGIETTHSLMSKFESKHAPGYLNVSTTIKVWVNQCMPTIQARWAAEKGARTLAQENETNKLVGIVETDNNLNAPQFQGQGESNILSVSDRPLDRPTANLAQSVSSIYSNATAVSTMSAFLPTIKCSICAQEIEISMMSEHVCGLAEPMPPLEPSKGHGPYNSPPLDMPTPNLAQSVSSMHLSATTSPTPYFVKPRGFRPNSLFVGREDELEKMHRMLFNRKRRAVGVAAVLLQSIPGGGKTHLAREYVYRHLEDFPGGVFWVTAESKEQLEAGFWHIASTVALKPSEDGAVAKDMDNFVKCVIDWFSTRHHWLLVLDGVHFNHTEELRKFIPDSTNSSLLYTSTQCNVGGDHQFMNPGVIRVPFLSPREAQELFLKEVGIENPTTADLGEAMKLVQRMDFLPKIIHVAAMRLKATQEPLAKFAKDYASGPKLQALDSYVTVVNQLRNIEAYEALNLINVLAFFSNSIPVEMISLGLRAIDIPVKAYKFSNGYSLNNTLTILNSYALISRNEHDIFPHSLTSSKAGTQLRADNLDVVRIHSVVQDFFIDSLQAVGTRSEWLTHSIAVFIRSYEQASIRVQSKINTCLIEDYRSYEIHGVRLLTHLLRVEHKDPTLRLVHETLATTLSDIRTKIVLKTDGSSQDNAESGDITSMRSIFDRTIFSPDIEPETPGPTDNYSAGVSVLATHDGSPLEPPITVNNPAFKYPAMPAVDDGYDSDLSSISSTSIMRDSHLSNTMGVLEQNIGRGRAGTKLVKESMNTGGNVSPRGQSATEVALGKISKSSSPQGRSGEHIHGPSSERPSELLANADSAGLVPPNDGYLESASQDTTVNSTEQMTASAGQILDGSVANALIQAQTLSDDGLPPRRRENDHSDPPNGDNREPKRLASNVPRDKPDSRLACPFRKHDPCKFNINNHLICAVKWWKNISRLKEHIYRRHGVQIHCPRCWILFESQDELYVHLSAKSICDLKPERPIEGITAATLAKLRSRKRLPLSNEDRWQDIYKLLFPEDNRDISPYFVPVKDDAAQQNLAPEKSLAEYDRLESPQIFSNLAQAQVQEAETHPTVKHFVKMMKFEGSDEGIEPRVQSLGPSSDSGYTSMPFPAAPSTTDDISRASIHDNQDIKQLTASPNDQGDNQTPENVDDCGLEVADCDAQSIVSDRDEIFSQIAARRTHQEILAERHLTVLLAQNEDLTPLYDLALERMEKEHFVDNFRKILKRYYLDLVQSANTNLEQATVHLLRSRWSRVRIAQDIVAQVSPKTSWLDAVPLGDIQEAEDKSRELEDWIAGNPGLAPPPESQDMMGEADNPDGATSDSDWEEGEGNARGYPLPNVGEMEKFLLHGNSFRSLITNTCLFLLPASLASLSRVLMTIPYQDVYFSSEDNTSVLNRIKGFVEEYTEENWNWWPLQPRMQRLAKDQTRVHWTCHCGRNQWAEISQLQAETYRLILQRNKSTLWNNHLCRSRRKSSWHATFKGLITKMADPISTGTKQSGTQGITQPVKPQNVHLRPSGGRAQQSSHTPHNPAGPATNNQNGVQVAISGLPGADLYVLFGVKGPRRTLELEQIKIKERSNDNVFFQSLKHSYKVHRGFWRYWFSIWQLAYCDFVKFKKIRANRIIHHSKSLPEDIIYEYAPRPPTAEIPPILPHEFELAFSACSSNCPFSAVHDCVEPPIGTFAIERIPKRKGLIEIKGDNPEFVWGIQAQHAISFLRMVFYHVLIFAGTFAFWGWWLATHPNDLQNAAVPITTVGVLLSLFWSSAGLLKAFRAQP